MPQITKHGTRFWWVGVQCSCGMCQCEWTTQSTDRLVRTDDDATPRWINVACPECGARYVIERVDDEIAKYTA